MAYKGKLADTVYQLVGGLRSGMGYCGVNTIALLKKRARFIQVSAASVQESHPHDVEITVEAPNEPPVASAVSFNATEDITLSDFLSATDPQGDSLTFSIVAQPTNGSVVINPDACKSCGICVDNCEDEALKPVEQDPEVLATARDLWSVFSAAAFRAVPTLKPSMFSFHSRRSWLTMWMPRR